MSPTTSPSYLGLSKAQEYTLKPAYIFGKSFLQLEKRLFGPRDTSKAIDKLVKTVYLAVLFKRMVTRFRARKQPIVIVYASVTGNCAKYASDLGSILRCGANVSFFDACGGIDKSVLSLIESSSCTVFVSSTQGNGELPSQSKKFFSYLFTDNGNILSGKQCAVLGFGCKFVCFCLDV